MAMAFQRPLAGQIFEGVKITSNKSITLSRREKWGQDLPPKLNYDASDESQMKTSPKYMKSPPERE